MPPGAKARDFFSTYTKDLNAEDLGKLFTRETPEAYRFFARGVNTAELEGLPWHRRALSLPARLLHGLHDAPVAGAAGHLRHRARGVGDRVVRAVPGHRHPQLPPAHRAVLRALRGARTGVPRRHALAAHRVPVAPPAGAARGGGSPVAQAGPGGRARDSERDAAGRHVVRPQRRGVRPHPAGQHRRRRLLRHPAPARRHGDHRPRRRRRQGESRPRC